MSTSTETSNVFDEPSMWRIEAVDALGLGRDDLIAVMSPGPAFPAVLRSLDAALVSSPRVIVDLGAGTGGVSEWMRTSTGASVYAVEPEARARQAARRAFPQLLVIEGHAHATSLPDSCADAVVMSGVVSLMSDIGEEVAEVDRLLNTSGIFAIADLFSATAETWSSAPNVFRSTDELEQILDRHGFTVTSFGLGDPVADPSWAAAAQAVDEWIDTHCAGRPGYEEWNSDRAHLRHHIDSGRLIGGCLVAQRR